MQDPVAQSIHRNRVLDGGGLTFPISPAFLTLGLGVMLLAREEAAEILATFIGMGSYEEVKALSMNRMPSRLLEVSVTFW
jgi:hypothetical protein